MHSCVNSKSPILTLTPHPQFTVWNKISISGNLEYGHLHTPMHKNRITQTSFWFYSYCIQLHTHTHTYAHTCMHTCTHACTHTHTHTYTHTHTLPCSCCHCSSTISCLGFWRRPHSALLQEYPCGTVQTQREMHWLHFTTVTGTWPSLHHALHTCGWGNSKKGNRIHPLKRFYCWSQFICPPIPTMFINHPFAQCVCISPIPTMCVYQSPICRMCVYQSPICPMCVYHPFAQCVYINHQFAQCVYINHQFAPCLYITHPFAPCVYINHPFAHCVYINHPFAHCVYINHPFAHCVYINHPLPHVCLSITICPMCVYQSPFAPCVFINHHLPHV